MTVFAAILTAIGMLAALVARRGIRNSARMGGVADHLRRLLTLIALLLALRLLFMAWPVPFVMASIMVVAAWLPFATLRLAEELVRRHAPRPLKLAALIGGVAFSIMAATLGLVWTREALLALGLFQGLTVIGVLVHLFAQRQTVSLAERRTVDLLTLAVLVSIPLLATDFQGLFPDLPVRGGAFAALIFVLACSRMASEQGRPMALLVDIAVAFGAGAIMAFASHQAGLLPPLTFSFTACAIATAALLLLIERFARASASDDGLLYDLARNGSSRAAILTSHPLLASAVRIGPGELSDLPSDAVGRLAQARVISRGSAVQDEGAAGAAIELLDRHSATHLLRLSSQPVSFLAISGGTLAEERLTAELEIVGRLLEGAE